MRVSVVVPLYNKAAHVARSLESIAAQTYTEFEVIIVDDGSTDAGPEIVSRFPDQRFRLVRQANAGPGAARNRGVAEAAGELLAFLDADDEWLPDYLAHNVEALDRASQEVAAVTSGYLEWPSGIDRQSMWRQRGLNEGIFKVAAETPPMLLVHVLAYMSCWNTVVRASVVRDLGGFYSKTRALYAEDSWLWLQLLLRHPVLFRFEPLTRYHREASELTAHQNKARPIEPFLIDPEPLETNCPPALQELLRQVLAIRAMKTACVLGYFGEFRTAKDIRSRFVQPGDARLPYFLPSLICTTPIGGALGKAHRLLRSPKK